MTWLFLPGLALAVASVALRLAALRHVSKAAVPRRLAVVSWMPNDDFTPRGRRLLWISLACSLGAFACIVGATWSYAHEPVAAPDAP